MFRALPKKVSDKQTSNASKQSSKATEKGGDGANKNRTPRNNNSQGGTTQKGKDVPSVTSKSPAGQTTPRTKNNQWIKK